jgi:predicted MFS family arabinose efflux permease
MKMRLPRASRQIIVADLFSDIGNQFITLFLVDRLVFQSDSAVSSLVLLCLIHQLPAIFFSPLAGKGVDRLGPGRWMVLVNVSKCLLVGAFALVSDRWAVLAVYLIFVTASLFFAIGRLSLIPMLMYGERILRFNAVNERIAIGGAILSPWLIGTALTRTGQTMAPMAAALIFCGAALLLATLPDLRRAGALTGGQNKDSGADLLQTDRGNPGRNNRLRVCFYMLGLVILGGGFLNLGMPLLFKTTLNGDIARWGFILSAFQAGAFLSTLLLPRCSVLLQRKSTPSLGFLTLSTAMFMLPFVSGYMQLAGLMVVFGCGFTLLQLFWESRIQQHTPPAAIGRTMSQMSAFKGLCYLTAVLCGAVISTFWSAESFLMVGAAVLGSAAFIVRRV